jgi:hypothetical protein
MKDGKYNGKGELVTFRNGHKSMRYDGYFLDGKFSGQGALEYPNKDKYEGQFKEGKK